MNIAIADTNLISVFYHSVMLHAESLCSI